MPSLSTKLTADAGPMTAEFAKAEVVAKRFGKTIADLRAQDDARLVANSNAIKQLQAAKNEEKRYQETLQNTASGLRTVADAHAAENAALLAKANAYKQFNAASVFNRGVSGTEQMLAGSKADQYRMRKLAIMGPRETGNGFVQFMAKEAAISAGPAIAQGASQGFWKNFSKGLSGAGSGGMSQLVSVVSNTMSSLGSGMSPARIVAQQLPNVLQAFVSMSGQLLGKLTAFIFNPITLAVAAITAAVAGSAFMVKRYFDNLKAGLENVGEKFGLARNTISELNDEMVRGADVAANFRQWMRALGGETLSTAQKTDILLGRMREQFRLQQEIADKRGQSPGAKFGAELSQLEKELAVIERAKEAAYEKMAADKASAAALASQYNSREAVDQRVSATKAGERGAQMAKFADAITAQLRIGELEKRLQIDGAAAVMPRFGMGGAVGAGVGAGYGANATVSVAEELKKLKETVVTVTVDGQKFHGTLQDAIREQEASNLLAVKLKQVQDDLKALLEKKKALTQGETESIKSLTHQESELLAKMGVVNPDAAKYKEYWESEVAKKQNAEKGFRAAFKNEKGWDLAETGMKSIDEWMEKMVEKNPTWSREELIKGYDEKFGGKGFLQKYFSADPKSAYEQFQNAQRVQNYNLFGSAPAGSRSLTENQRIGAYAMPQMQTQIEVLKQIAKNTDPKNQPANDGWGN